MTEKDLKIAVVGLASGWSSKLLCDVLEEKTGFRLLVDMDRVLCNLNKGSLDFDGFNLAELDGVIIKKIGANYSPDMLDRLNLLDFIAQKGVRIFSKPASIMGLMDRLFCTTKLRLADIPMPETLITEDIDLAYQAINEMGNVILKPLYSTKARGMKFLKAGQDNLKAELKSYQYEGNQTFYIQKKANLPGKDLGVVFLGGEYLATYARVSGGTSWNTTILAGGKYEKFDPPQDIIELAQRAQAPFDLDFTCVDVAETDEGPIVFEVSAFGGFRGLRDGCNLNAAELYSDYAIAKILEEK